MCEVKNCRGDGALIYFGHEVCEKCWEKHCNGEIDLKKELEVE